VRKAQGMKTRGNREELVFAQIAQASGTPRLEALVARHRELLHPGVVDKLAELAREKARVNGIESLRVAEAALAVAEMIGGDEPLARGLRAKANALWVLNKNQAAVALFDRAASLYQKSGNETELGRTLSTSIQALIRVGEYNRALEGSNRAREIFIRTADKLRLARLELNVANIYHRQDRLHEALKSYENSYQQLVELRDAEAIGVALHNMAVCLIGLNDFHRALATHRRAREFCLANGMPAIAAQADYNISYLYYLRGEYSRALEGLRSTAAAARESGDTYHAALCPMDQAEVYLELNMTEEAAEMAQDAFNQFQTLGMNYESAKSLAFLAMANAQPGRPAASLSLFAQAREMFVREKNLAWPWLIDLYQAILLFDAGRNDESRRLASGALDFFRGARRTAKEVLCLLLLARIALRDRALGLARNHCATALERLRSVEAPHLLYQAQLFMGQIEELAGDSLQAATRYRAARAAIESMRESLRGEELKIAFMRNKTEVYENLVRLCLQGAAPGCTHDEIFHLIEEAKSRSLRDLFFEASSNSRDTSPEVRGLREELNWYYHRLEADETAQEAATEQSLTRLRAEIKSREKALLSIGREQPTAGGLDFAASGAPAFDVDAIRAALPADATLLEYFRAGDQFVAVVVTAVSLDVVPLSTISTINPVVRLLQFQFSKFRLGPSYIATIAHSSLDATRSHLADLYKALIAPVRGHLKTRRLVIVPHEQLHHVPLHALYDGSHYLCDEFDISYAPSAGVYVACRALASSSAGGALVLGVPDLHAPQIEEEARTVAASLPGSECFVGEQATRQVLREKGTTSRFIHIATHGRFRRDNPMFSAIRLGDGYLTLYDLYGMSLPAELIALSGCSTGLNVVTKGDELLGLVRGLLQAGARTLMLTLWDVLDRTTAEFVRVFYYKLQSGLEQPVALRESMREMRSLYPHPFYWAPFFLTGAASLADGPKGACK
jgi:tetratricopeptide (TPR) repeat protein